MIYKLNNQGLIAIKKASILRNLYLMLLVALVLILTGVNAISVNGVNDAHLSLIVNSILAVLLTITAVIMTVRNLNMRYGNYTLAISADTIEKTSNQVKTNRRVPIISINEVRKVPDGRMVIFYEERSKFIIVPRWIDGREDLENNLKQLGLAFKDRPFSFYQRNSKWVHAVFLALLTADLIFQDKTIVTAIGVFLLIALAALTIRNLRDEQGSSSIRKRITIRVVIVLGVIVTLRILNVLGLVNS